MKNRNVKEMYKLPEKVIFCKECTISNQWPRITFDTSGVCSAYNFAKHKKKPSTGSTERMN